VKHETRGTTNPTHIVMFVTRTTGKREGDSKTSAYTTLSKDDCVMVRMLVKSRSAISFLQSKRSRWLTCRHGNKLANPEESI
jgi:hypothetical protein